MVAAVVGEETLEFCEELVVDETTGELLIVYAATLEELDALADAALNAA